MYILSKVVEKTEKTEKLNHAILPLDFFMINKRDAAIKTIIRSHTTVPTFASCAHIPKIHTKIQLP